MVLDIELFEYGREDVALSQSFQSSSPRRRAEEMVMMPVPSQWCVLLKLKHSQLICKGHGNHSFHHRASPPNLQ
jgi:hypothetical protein